MDTFRIRLNCIDHYQSTPTRYDPRLRKDYHPSQAAKEARVPVIRVFGSTETGQKVCAHIHGAFPYLYIEYGGSLDKNTVSQYILKLHLSIDHALALNYRRDASKEQPRFVARITLVKGVPFYGYHVGYRFYLKIYMLNPLVMTRLADLLQQGLIMNRKFQPYESHLQYLLQFMADYNLYGCDYIKVRNARFRSPIPEPAGPDDPPRIWDNNTIPPHFVTDDPDLPRVSHCSIELDICVQDILNRRAIKERALHHEFTEMKHPLPSDLKLVHSMAGLWKSETKRRKRLMGKSTTDSSPFPPEVLVPMSADPRYSQPPPWVHEKVHREQLQQLMNEDSNNDFTDVNFSNFVKPEPCQEIVQTALQSVEDMFPENLRRALGLEDKILQANPHVASQVEIDKEKILELEAGEEAKQLFPDEDAVAQQDKDIDADLVKARDEAPVAGEASGAGASQKASKTITELRRTINGLGNGIAVSGLRTGMRPRIPLSKNLITAASTWDLTSKDCPGQADQTASVGMACPTPARKGKTEGAPIKKRKFAAEGEEIFNLASKRPLNVAQFEARNHKVTPSKPSQPSQPTKSTTKKGSTKPGRSQQLNFPVVKDPSDPNTKLRLSQKNTSQRSGEETPEKKVSFDFSVSIRDDPLNQAKFSEVSSSRQSPLTPRSPHSSTEPRILWNGPTTMFVVNCIPPSCPEVFSTMEETGLPNVIYQDAFYSKDRDVPARSREYAGREYRLKGNTVPYLPDFDATGLSPATYGVDAELGPGSAVIELEYGQQRRECTIRSWEIASLPPTFDQVSKWWKDKQKKKARHQDPVSGKGPAATQKPNRLLSQIAGATPGNTHGFKYSPKQKSTSVQHEAQYMSTMSLELHINTRGKLLPNPEEDEIQCIFWCLGSDEQCLFGSQSEGGTLSGIIVLSEDGLLKKQIRNQSSSSVEVVEESTELDLMVRLVEIVRTHDPDILTGYEVHGTSWGYLVERAGRKYDFDLCNEFSRMKSESFGKSGKEADKWGFNTTSMIHVTGRHVINVWRAMRGELNLLQYTMENVAWHLLHRRVPHFSYRALTTWYTSGRPRDLSKVIRYYSKRARMNIEILEANELIPRTSEQARVLGVDFFSVFSRGSQFKVESIMFRIAKPENFMLVSPSRKQVGGQNALECLPLVMEPQSNFYPGPLLVLDFQSLYPSVMIAYNYCYSTCLGRIANWRGTSKLGIAEYKRQEGLLQLLKDHINIAPNGVMYTKPEVRKSLLAKMLTEILETRVMVKSGMKQDKEDKALQKLLHNRQLALKLLANVTYGYTSASFSGRMPCSEIADSIVQTGRETLERAIAYIHSVERWGAEVVYGDTDSLFIHLKGRTRDQAFDIGAEIAKEITDMNPRPMKLKFEKVYHPCVLLAKKRYVGYKYETRDQTVPEFDAKGIETVRRDGTPAEQKIEEKALKLLFETADLSQVKSYFQSQCSKIMQNQVSIQDFCFAREVKLGTYSDKGPGPAGAVIATKRMLEDMRAEPQYGERVPYVVMAGAPGARLIDRCVGPEDLLNSPHASLDSEYYITKNIIPPLERIFNLVGANVRAWYDEMPKVQQIRSLPTTAAAAEVEEVDTEEGGDPGKKRTLEHFLSSTSCISCNVKMKASSQGDNIAGEAPLPVCDRCAQDAAATMVILQTRLNAEERKYDDVVRVCQSCTGFAPLEGEGAVDACESRDCPVFYSRVKHRARVEGLKGDVGRVVQSLGGRI
ncbi:putative DNA polymerase zeta catalytic subunit, partial [Cladorrhinum sp. PSN332]